MDAFVKIIDARGITSPLPLLDLRRALDMVSPRESVELVSDDESMAEDVNMFISASGHELEASEEGNDGVFRFRIRKT